MNVSYYIAKLCILKTGSKVIIETNFDWFKNEKLSYSTKQFDKNARGE